MQVFCTSVYWDAGRGVSDAPANPQKQGMDIKDDILQGVQFKQTPNIWKLPIVGPKFLVIHYSTSGTVSGTVAHLTNPKSQVSAHVVIGRSGEVVQVATFKQRAWHCGLSEWKGLESLNYYAIGIELVNWGPVELDKDGKTFRSKWGQVIPADEVEQATHKNESSPRYWHKYTREQLAKGAEVARAILEAYTSIEMILGHDDIAPGRKIDPGPLFPMNQFLIDCGFMDAPEPAPITDALIMGPALFTLKGGVLYVTVSDKEGDVTAELNPEEADTLCDWLNEKMKA